MRKTKTPSGRAVLSLAAVLLTLSLAACSSDKESSPTTSSMTSNEQESQGVGETVEIKLFDFQPPELNVSAGTTVKWTNQDDILHTVTSGERDSPDGVFDGQLEGKGTSFSTTFDSPGTYPYHCTRHPGMDAVVVVEP